MVIFNSFVKLPEGTEDMMTCQVLIRNVPFCESFRVYVL